ncbi:MAG: lamin tail domain-containing protein, partial [Myxococcota bacterium]|nr:lamin tail domain-containing protein [Myxococcota bacterium]
VDDLIGRLDEGLFADILAIDGDRSRPYEAIIAAQTADVAAVFIGGTLYYGHTENFDPSIALNEFCEPVSLCGVEQQICVKQSAGAANTNDGDDWARFTYQEHIDYLEEEISSKPGADGPFAYAYNLYPLFECTPTYSCALGNENISGLVSDADQDGDEFADAIDNCPAVFNPNQGDLDGDGRGDACDPCPWAELDCPCAAPAGSDRDGDGVEDELDNCPAASNADQADGDSDGRGDSCDACPEYANPGEAGCPASIYALKRGELPEESRFSVEGVVSAVLPNQGGFFLQIPEGDPNYEGPDYSGVYVYLGERGAPLAPSAGARVRVDGRYQIFFDQKQLSGVSAVEALGEGEALNPVPAVAADVATGGARAEALEGVWLTLGAVSVTSTTLESGPGDAPENNEFEVEGSLRVNDLFYRPEPPPSVGARIEGLRGILRFANGDFKLEPTGPADLLTGPPSVAAIRPAESAVRVGETLPVNGAGEALTLRLTSPARAGGLEVTLESSDPGRLQVGPVLVPEGSLEVPVMVEALEPGRVTLTASLPDGSMASAEVEILAADAGPSMMALNLEPSRLSVGAEGRATVTINLPALDGYSVTFSDPSGLLEVPPVLFFDAGAVSATAQISAGEASGTGQLRVSDGVVSATVNYEITDAPLGAALVINEIDYDQPGDDNAEFIELYNASGAAFPLAGVSLELINGSNQQVYESYALSNAGAELPAGGFLLIAPQAILAASGAALQLPLGGSIQNGGPDAIRLVDGAGAVIDALSYEGSVVGAVEGEGLPDELSDRGAESIGRCPDGADRDENSVDFSTMVPSPGQPNSCP